MYRYFGRSYFHHPNSRRGPQIYPSYGGRRLLQNVGTYLPYYTTSYLRRLNLAFHRSENRKYRFILYRVFIVQAYQTSQYVLPRGGVFLSKWHSSFAGSFDCKMNIQSACDLNSRYFHIDGQPIEW
jgi:hypothetical protein